MIRMGYFSEILKKTAEAARAHVEKAAKVVTEIVSEWPVVSRSGYIEQSRRKLLDNCSQFLIAFSSGVKDDIENYNCTLTECINAANNIRKYHLLLTEAGKRMQEDMGMKLSPTNPQILRLIEDPNLSFEEFKNEINKYLEGVFVSTRYNFCKYMAKEMTSELKENKEDIGLKIESLAKQLEVANQRMEKQISEINQLKDTLSKEQDVL